MRKFLIIVGLMSISSVAFSLGELNCSDAKGELRRVEKERWGANDIAWYYKGEKMTPEGSFGVEMLEETLHQVSGDQKNGQYLIDVSLSFTDGSESVTKTVLCESWRNGAID